VTPSDLALATSRIGMQAQVREIVTGWFIASGEAVLLLGPPEPAS
jgi:hypothetical protein